MKRRFEKLWAWWQVKIRGHNWCEYECECLAVKMSMAPKCPLCGTKVKSFHKDRHEIDIMMENWDGQ